MPMERLLAEVSRMEKLFSGRATIPPPLVALGLRQVRDFIQGRRAEIEAELQQPAKRWEFPMRKEVYTVNLGKVSATFSGSSVANTWLPRMPQGQGRIEFDYYGRHYAGDVIDVKAGPNRDSVADVSIFATARVPGIELPITVWAVVSTNSFHPGTTVEVTGRKTQLSLFAGDLLADDFRLLAWMGESGSIQLDQAETRPGAPVSGKLEGALTLLPWDDFDLRMLKAAAPLTKK